MRKLIVFLTPALIILAGILVVKYREDMVTWMTIGLGAIFFMAGVISCISYYIQRKHVQKIREKIADGISLMDANGNVVEQSMPTFPIVGIGSLVLGIVAIVFWFFGIGSAIVCGTSVAACVFFEWAINKFMLGNKRNTICDGSAVLTGLLLGFNLPSNLPVWIIIIGALFAIGVGKMTFGGLGNNLFNPALVGRAALLVAFPAQMTTWPKIGQLTSYLDAETGATPLAIMKDAIKYGDASILKDIPSSLDLFLGNHPDGAGAVGEICALALLLGFVYMLWRKIITWHIPVSIIATVFIFAGLLHLASPVYADPVSVILSGGMMLGAIFMATDYVTSPMTPKGQLIYGVAIGFLSVVIRNWGAYPEGMSFAILIMNAFTPIINNYIKPKRFGEASK